MSAFSADWLALREAADARSRDRALAARLADVRSGDRALAARLPAAGNAIFDLGAGTGANLRWLAPGLGYGQRWHLVDKDDALLAAARRRLYDWSRAAGYRCAAADRGLEIAAADFDCAVEFRALDFSRSLGSLAIPSGALVTASALLDLVSEAWLAELVARVVDREATVLLALSYDGRVALEPPMADDDRIIGLINRHQRTDKGFGAALGPDAWRQAREGLEREGCEVRAGDSSWVLTAADHDLQHALIAGWSVAAAEIAPAERSCVERWCALRQAQAARRELSIRVGHRDLAAWRRSPAGQAQVPGAARRPG